MKKVEIAKVLKEKGYINIYHLKLELYDKQIYIYVNGEIEFTAYSWKDVESFLKENDWLEMVENFENDYGESQYCKDHDC